MAVKKKKKLKSWQRRKRRRTRFLLCAVFVCVVILAVIAEIKLLLPFETVDLADYVTYTYSGYNTRGTVDVQINDEMTSTLMQRLVKDYDEALVHPRKCEPEDYNSFYNSLSVKVDTPQFLSNGSKFKYTVNYNEELAQKLKLKVKNNEREVMVNGLVTAAVIPYDTLFEGISFEFTGISPTITATMNNNTVNPYLTDVEYVIENQQETYSEGDVIRVRAFFDEKQCLEKHFVIDTPLADCYKDFTIQSNSHYIRSAAELPRDIIDRAVSAANNAFNTKSANEFGVRVYFEAGISPVYVNKKSTFEWISYGPISAYLKVANDEIAGKNSHNYNDLDIVYSGTLTQADGSNVSVEAVVRFKDIIVNNDGSYTYDFSKPAIVSCSHYDARIKKNIITNYEKDHSIEKINLK